VALQGLLINVLSYRVYRRTSAYIQFLLLAAILIMFFATPDLRRPEELAHLRYIPAFWFVGLYHAVLGTPSPEAWELAHYAVYGLAIAFAVAVVSYSAGYGRFVRRAVEDSGLAPAPPRQRLRWLRAFADRYLLRDGRERAVFHFVRRTVMRSRMHRLILAGYLSVGLTYALLGFAGAPLVLSFFALLGLRVLFSVPVDLGANWLFRITERPRPTAELSAIWKLMFSAAVAPMTVLSLPVYSLLWGPGLALRHVVLITLLALIAVEALLGDFRKIPFTCSYLPGKSNLKMMFVVYGVTFSSIAWAVTHVEMWAAREPLRFVIAAAACAAVLALLIRRRRGERGWIGFLYDEKPDWQAISLEFT
jgi:hypothetical protein